MPPKQHSVEEEIYTHECLWRSASAISNQLVVGSKDNLLLLLPTLLTTYLAYESFINFCGYILCPDLWASEKENFKGKSLEHKIEVMLPQFKWCKGERPYQTLRKLSDFRDLAAHGKVQRNQYTAECHDDGSHFSFDHAWDEYLTCDELNRFRADTKAFCETLLVAARQVSDHPHLLYNAFEGPLASGSSGSHDG